jgi:aspartate/methionine/tyrosine aminotransferase
MNPRVQEVPASLIRELNAKRNAESIDLGLGEPTLMPDVAPFEAATRWVGEHGCRYTANIGDPELCEAIAAHYQFPQLERAENVCITTGSQEAVYCVIKALLDPGADELLVVEPAFAVYVKIAQVEGIPVRTVSMRAEDGFAYDAERIIEAIGPKTRMIVVCSPCNPTGRVISRDAVGRIVRALRERKGAPVYVLHDEIYREQAYSGDAGWFAEVYPHTIAVNSLSKSNSLTGLRLGWAIASREETRMINKMHAWATTCASTFAQRVALEIFRAGALGVNRDWYRARRELVMKIAQDAGLTFVEPDGAFYLAVHAGGDSLHFALELIEKKNVVVIPGVIFGTAFEGWLRTSFVGPPDALRRGYEQIALLANGRKEIPQPKQNSAGLRIRGTIEHS